MFFRIFCIATSVILLTISVYYAEQLLTTTGTPPEAISLIKGLLNLCWIGGIAGATGIGIRYKS